MAKKKKKSAGGGGRSTATTTTTTAAANEAGAKGLIWVDPSRCRFQHSRIRPHFSGCGRSVHETLEDIKAGTTRISDLPPIQVIVGGGGENECDDDDDNNNNEGVSNAEPWYFSLNNRRLWVLKRLREEGFLEPHGNKVAVRVRQPKSQKERERYTLANCSLDAKIMGEKKQPQLPQQQQQQQPQQQQQQQQQPPRIRIRTEEQEPEAEKPEQQQGAAESTTSSLPAAMGDGNKGDDSGYDSESSGNEGDEASIEKQVSVTISNRFGGMMMDDSSSSGSDDGSDGV